LSKDVSKITVTYDITDDGYGEQRQYDGTFGRLQLMRTLVGLYNDVMLGHSYQVESVDLNDLTLLGDKIEKLLKQGERKNAN
jgi:hypothetical protein